VTGLESELLARKFTRRQLIKGFAAAGAATWAASHGLAQAVPKPAKFGDFTAIAPSSSDALQVPDGYVADVLIKWGDEFGDGLFFGYNADYTTYLPLRGHKEGLLWVNHEYVWPYYVTDWRSSQDASWDPRVEPYASLMAIEKAAVGGSIVHIRQLDQHTGPWEVVEGSPYNRRFTAASSVIPYDGPAAGSGLVPEDGALGTLANCSGAHTPWKTVLSCEENYQSFGLQRFMPFNLGWDNAGDPNYYTGEVQPQAPGPNARNAYGQAATEVPNYGYVVEIDPYTGTAVRHTALGRIHHENVAMRIASDGRVVAYTGDDAPAADGMFFKFVSAHSYSEDMSRAEAMTLLSEGQLYVAQFIEGANNASIDSGTGKWHPLDMSDPESVVFTTQWVRDNIIPAVGGTTAQFQVPRAEDCELVPGRPTDVIVALTSARGRPADSTAYGAVRLLEEASEDPDSLTFTWTNLLEGGPDTGYANPDNLTYASDGLLWMATDISTSAINPNTAPFLFHGNNALFAVPQTGPNANIAFRFANAPVRAELTGPTFVFGSKTSTLFLSVQHPGELRNNELDLAIDVNNYPSWWPGGNKTAGTGTPGKPAPAVVAIRKL
jgi:uncharacterized protein